MVLYLSLGLDIPQAGQQKQGHFHEQNERKWNLYWRSTKDHMIHLCFFVLTCWPCFAVVLLNKVCTKVEKKLVTTGFLILMTQTSVKLWACDCFSLENDMSKCCRGLMFLFVFGFVCFFLFCFGKHCHYFDRLFFSCLSPLPPLLLWFSLKSNIMFT